MKKKAFFAKRRQIRVQLKALEEALETGYLSPHRIQRYMDALVKAGSESRKTREKLRGLKELLSLSKDAKQMWRSFSAIQKVASSTLNSAKAGYQAFVKGSAMQVAKRTDAWWAGKSKFEKGLFVLSVAAAASDAYAQTQRGVAPSEAIARSSVDFAIDLVIGGVPALAAAEMATQILFTTYAHATGSEGVSDATLSNTSKWVAKTAFDRVAEAASAAGTYAIALERYASGDPTVLEILANVDFARLRSSLSRVEERLGALPPGHPGEARLLRMRFAFRRLIRAKQRGR
jgi:hypothetical protein